MEHNGAFVLCPADFGPCVLCPAEFGSNATFAPQTHEDIVSGAKTTAKIIFKKNILIF